MNRAEPAVSVLIATRSRPEMLNRCLTSVLSSERRDVEVVVIDQSDEPIEALEAHDDERLRYVHSSTIGKSAGLNVALGMARGCVLAFTDDDCTVPPNWLDEAERALDRHPDAQLVFGVLQSVEHDPGAHFVPITTVSETSVVSTPIDAHRRGGAGANMIARAELFETIGGFDEVLGPGAPFEACEEFDVYYRTLAAGESVVFDPVVTTTHWNARSYADGSGRRLLRAYGFGEGAVIGKHLRLADARMLVVLARITAQDVGVIARRLVRGQLSGAGPLLAKWRGIAEGITHPVDRDRRVFVRPTGDRDRQATATGGSSSVSPVDDTLSAMAATSNAGRVTVMIPSYNYAQYLGEAVASAASQPEADVVIVDNGSTDASPELGAELAERHDNVRFVRYETNDGIIASFNRCRAEIRGDYAMLLCADDMLTPGSLARSVEVLDSRPDVGLAYGTAVDFADSRDLDLAGLPSTTIDVVVHSGDAWIDRLCRFGRNPIRNPEAVMRSSVAADAGLYEPDCPYTSDLNMWLRVAARSDVAYLRGPVQALFRQHDSNAGSAFPHNSLAELEQRWTAFERFLSTESSERAKQWEDAARRRIASEGRYSASRVFAWQLESEAAELLEFAERVDPGGAHGVERAAWALRRRLGPKVSHRFPGFLVRPLLHRTRRVVADRRRMRVGVG